MSAASEWLTGCGGPRGIDPMTNTYHAGNPGMGFNFGVGESNVDFRFSDYEVDSYND